jgi:hypothetical protein
VLVNNVPRLPKKFEFKIQKNENFLPTACTCCWQRAIFANSTIRLLGKKALRQHVVALLAKGCSLCEQLKAKLLAKRTTSTPFGRAGASLTAFLSQQECCWERTPSPTADLQGFFTDC